MILKAYEPVPEPSDPRQRAGVKAESQMAFYLNREFAREPHIFVLHDLRLVDPGQPEHTGVPGKCQIDALVVHQKGMFIVESKSVSEQVWVRPDGTGGDEWLRVRDGRKGGMPSPIQQARRQGEFLRRVLQPRREALLGKMAIGMRTLGKVLVGTDQRGFLTMPIQLLVAISDEGIINRLGGWKEPMEPLPVYVCKADQAAEKIRHELDEHASHGGLLKKEKGDYGKWWMKPEEVAVVAKLLVELHTPKGVGRAGAGRAEVRANAGRDSTIATPAVEGVACKSCGGADLSAHWGRYGYYWKCAVCGTNTAMPTVCSACGAEGRRGEVVRIRKEGAKYFRACEKCGIEERIWLEG